MRGNLQHRRPLTDFTSCFESSDGVMPAEFAVRSNFLSMGGMQSSFNEISGVPHNWPFCPYFYQSSYVPCAVIPDFRYPL